MLFDLKGSHNYDARPLSIPVTVQASAAVAKGARYEGELPIKLLPRLAEQVLASSSPLKVELEMSRASGYPAVRGRVAAELELMCQRCEKPFLWTLDARINLRLVTTEAQEHEALHDCDPYLVEDDTLPLRELVEQEALLALPMLARCESCENSVKAAPAKAQQKQPRKNNPFAALKESLKH